MAIQTCNQLLEKNLAIFALHLNFGGVPGPYEWRLISESIYDFSIATMQDAGWGPTLLCATNGQLGWKRTTFSPVGLDHD